MLDWQESHKFPRAPPHLTPALGAERGSGLHRFKDSALNAERWGHVAAGGNPGNSAIFKGH